MTVTIEPFTYRDNNGDIFCRNHAPLELVTRFEIEPGLDVYDINDAEAYWLITEKDVDVTVRESRHGGSSVWVYVPMCDSCVILGNGVTR
jgi:hypothetical protein